MKENSSVCLLQHFRVRDIFVIMTLQYLYFGFHFKQRSLQQLTSSLIATFQQTGKEDSDYYFLNVSVFTPGMYLVFSIYC